MYFTGPVRNPDITNRVSLVKVGLGDLRIAYVDRHRIDKSVDGQRFKITVMIAKTI